MTQLVQLQVAFNSAQVHVLMGQPGYKCDDPDHFALTVGNYILGGGGFALLVGASRPHHSETVR